MSLFGSFWKKGSEKTQRPAMPGKWQVGDKIANRFEIYQILGGEGKSGMGIVYICYDHNDQGVVALKTFQEKYFIQQKARDAFTNEALTWIKLDRHKNVVKANYVLNIESHPYICLEYIAGGNLDEWISTGRLSLDLALNFAIQFCNGMEYAYNKLNLIHRDIKPVNILITQNKIVKITDFGLAKTINITTRNYSAAKSSEMKVIQTAISGSPPWMAPEQWQRGDIDIRADIYSFGIVLYQMITTRYPYSVGRKSWQDIHLTEPPSPISTKRVPGDLNNLIFRCLEKNRDNRYQNFTCLKKELSKIYYSLTSKYIDHEEGPQNLEEWELVNKGASLGELGRHEEAITCSDRVLVINPGNAMAWNNKAVDLKELGSYEEALSCCDKALEIDSEFVEAWNNRGAILSKLGKYAEEIVCYKRALNIAPRYAEIWSNMGIPLGKLGRHEEAVECYDKAVEINPQLSRVFVNKAASLISLNKYEEVLSCCENTLKVDPLSLEAWDSKGNVLSKLGRHNEAIVCYDKMLEIDPRVTAVWIDKVVTLGKLGKYIEVVLCCDKALEIIPECAEVWGNKGVAFDELNRFEEAIDCYDNALRLNPRLTEVLYNKACLLEQGGRLKKAYEIWKELFNILRDDLTEQALRDEIQQHIKGIEDLFAKCRDSF